MVTGALDLLLGTPDGSTACVAWATAPRRDLWLEMVHVVECVAPPKLHADRFLPATPIRVIVDVKGSDITARAIAALNGAQLRDSPVHAWLDKPAVRAILPKLTAAARRHSETKSEPVIAEAVAALDRQLGHELERLRALAAINPAVRPTEVAALEVQRTQLKESVEAARLRLDSVRLIVLGDL
jgi:ATP-dependent helicase HepA